VTVVTECEKCLEQTRSPGFWHACASVGIEEKRTTREMARIYLSEYHRKDHV
jgi:hypothetical protein